MKTTTHAIEHLARPSEADPTVYEYCHGFECCECGREYDTFFDADLCEAECLAGRIDFMGVTV